MATPDDLPQAYVAHRIAGRVRLRVPQMHKQPEYFARVREQLSSLSPVRRVTTDAGTTSVLIEHDGELADLGELGARRGLFRLDARPRPAPADVGTHLRSVSHRADQLLHGVSGGRADVDGLVALAFAGLGIRQVMNGKALPAGLTLIWQAVSMLRYPKN